MRTQTCTLFALFLATAPVTWAHPHLPHPQGAPEKGTIQDAKTATALPADTKVAIVDGAHHPEAAAEILQALARKPQLIELQIYGAKDWSADSFACLRELEHLEVLRIFDDSPRRKPGHLKHLAHLSTLRILQLYYSGD